ncbi:hypothetical protein AAW31_00045 [Nitrosomonas communis]|uniref:Uncharacterized protein n=2 Tax=Nitrosomonadaceae TaxID=206379 RepID=A0A0F7KCP0_9PROT|nr:hypothetical protein AAW31_00045 [Nitrosomonas communis]
MAEENKENIPVSTNKEAAKKEATKGEVSAMRPATDIERSFTEMERAFDRFFRRGWPSLWRWEGSRHGITRLNWKLHIHRSWM